MRLIYLANPYHSTEEIMEERHRRLMEVLASCANTTENLVFYSPIAHWHETAKHHKLPTSFSWWRERDFFMLRKCSALWVLPIEGWEDSYGVSQEIEFATDTNIPIFYIIDYVPSVVVTQEKPRHPLPLVF